MRLQPLSFPAGTSYMRLATTKCKYTYIYIYSSTKTLRRELVNPVATQRAKTEFPLPPPSTNPLSPAPAPSPCEAVSHFVRVRDKFLKRESKFANRGSFRIGDWRFSNRPTFRIQERSTAISMRSARTHQPLLSTPVSIYIHIYIYTYLAQCRKAMSCGQTTKLTVCESKSLITSKSKRGCYMSIRRPPEYPK